MTYSEPLVTRIWVSSLFIMWEKSHFLDILSHEAADNHSNVMSSLGKLQAAGEVGSGIHPREGHPKTGSAETQGLSPQLMAGLVATISSCLHSGKEHHGKTQFLLSSFGGWWLSQGMVPRDHGPRLQLNQTQLASPRAPTLLFHTNF